MDPLLVTRSRRPFLALLFALLTFGGGLGCDDKHSSEGAQPTPPPPSAALAASASASARKLPPSITETKRVRVGSDISYAPLESYKDGTKNVEGFDVDVCNMLVKKIDTGLSCDFQNDDFDRLLDDLAANKFDIVMSAMSDHTSRQAKADFVDYFRAGMSVIIKKGNPLKVKSIEDLCGRSLGAQKGTDEETFAVAQRTSCTNAGRAAVNIVTVKTDDESLAQLKAGRLAADLEDFPAADWTAKHAGGGNDFELLGTPSGRTPYGIAVAKNEPGLRDALVEALKEALADHSYETIVTNWHLEEGAVSSAQVNSGG
jgi:polar amino acid transport system substrate-binding protein